MESVLTLPKFRKYCACCGKPGTVKHHLVFGKSERPLADKDGLVIYLCNDCHNMAEKAINRIHENPMAEKLSKMLGQMAFEREKAYEGLTREEARQAFMKRYRRSYL